MNLAQGKLDNGKTVPSKNKKIPKKVPVNPGPTSPVDEEDIQINLNSKYSKYEEEVLIDPFLRPPICLIIIAAAIFIASIVTIILYDKVRIYISTI